MYFFVVLEVANIAKEDQTSLSDQGSPSGTFASFAKSARAVINFKSDDSQSVPGYERVTHRHASPKRPLTANPASQSIKSVDHEGNTSVSVIAPNGAHLETSRVYSRNEQEQHKLSQHLTSRQNASTDADLRARALDSTGEAHSTSSVVAAATGKSRRNDNRPKW